MTRALLAVAALAALPLAAPAAQTMRPDARPAAGTLSPRADRPAETLPVPLRAVSASGMDDCPGFVDPAAPDAVVEWPGGALQMSVRSAFDATLAVAGPDGVWRCNDDGDGLAPVIEERDAPRGHYAVWVGSYSQEQPGAAATLVAGMPPPVPVLMLDAEPTSGRLALAQGFEDQGLPTLAVRAGGPDAIRRVDVQTSEDSDFCTGYVDAARPTMVLDYAGAGDLAISATSDDESADLVLVVHTPGGAWRCSDDLMGTDPGINVETGGAGRYAVWVGTFSAGAGAVDATVRVFESFFDLPQDGDDSGGIFEPTPYSEGLYLLLRPDARAAVRLRVGSAPVSGTARVLPEGPNPVTGPACRGFIQAAPTATVEMRGPGPFGITAMADDTPDLVLVVQAPDGAWFCSDDANGLDPGIQFGTADDTAIAQGIYRVWAGTVADPAGDPDLGPDAMQPPGPTAVTVTAARGEITLSVPDYGSDDMGMMGGGEDFYEGTYSGQDLAPESPLATLSLTEGAGQMTVTVGSALVNPVDGEGCSGLIDARPTLAFTAGAAPLSVRASAGDEDLVMVARAPSGRWLCSDDAAGSSDPRIATDEAGRYAIWIGAFSRPSAPVQAQVSVE